MFSGILSAFNPMNWANMLHAQNQDYINNQFTQTSLGLSREAFEAQKSQQAFQNEQYLDNVDYQKALQNRIFDREDTAMTRSVQDHVAAGFSPLTALGSAFGAGSVVSQSVAPSNQVQNNQFTNHNTDYFGQALNSMLDRQDSAMSRALTMAMQTKELNHNVEMQQAEFANSEYMSKLARDNQEILLHIQHDNLREIEDIQSRNKMAEIIQSHEGQKVIQDMIIEGQANLQDDQQSWLDSQPKQRSWDMIVEQGLNFLKKTSPEFRQFVADDAQGWDIAFSFLYNLLTETKSATNPSTVDALKSFDSSSSNPFNYAIP